MKRVGLGGVHLHIERLVVDGLPAREREAFVQALEERLRGMAADVSLDWNAGIGAGQAERRIAKVDAGVLKAGVSADAAARQVAAAVRAAAMGRGSTESIKAAGGEGVGRAAKGVDGGARRQGGQAAGVKHG